MRRVHVNGLHHADGLLHRPVLRQRRVHRRLDVRRHRDQRLAAAVLRPQQHAGQLDQRRLEPGLLRRGRRAGPVLPGAGRAAVARTPRWPPPRSAARSRTSTSTAAGSTGCSSRRPARTPPAPAGRPAPPPGRSIPLSDFYVAKPVGLGAGDQQPARPRPQPAADPRGLRRRPDASRSSGPTPSCSGLGFATLTADRRRRGDQRRRRARRRHRRPDLRRRAASTRRCCCRSAASTRRRARPASTTAGATRPALQDVFFRIGGPHPGKATVSLEVNSDHVVLDDIWAWRADHGTGVGWTAEHRRHRADRQRRRRHRHRPVRRALPEVPGDLERRARHGHLLPERAALRRAEPGRVDVRTGARSATPRSR